MGECDHAEIECMRDYCVSLREQNKRLTEVLFDCERRLRTVERQLFAIYEWSEKHETADMGALWGALDDVAW